ncbi:rCG42839 [Rattus norvegicus]|uniref:RCG42839 n=1 Tax=Rattus norvegicus TaxID=10116 RepID=A6JZY2_RAT|nr:rCG42839 [Rattus norvegicus]
MMSQEDKSFSGTIKLTSTLTEVLCVHPGEPAAQ